MGHRLALGLLCAVAALPLSGCFLEQEHEGALREGLDVRVGGIDYTVFITRQLNLQLPDDRAYWSGDEARRGHEYFGIFLQACNRSDEDDDLTERAYSTSDHFTVVDTQGNEYEPVKPEKDNAFQYRPISLQPGECTPAAGSIPQQGPTGGMMLLFEFPLEAGENRPLELEIAGDGEHDAALVELDL